MRERIEEFCRLLRQSGVRVSTAEVIDSVEAVAAVGLEQPGRVRAALAATLVKRAEDGRVFDELFELYFLRDARFLARTAGAGSALAQAAGRPGQEPDPRAALRDGTDSALQRLMDELAARAPGLGPIARQGLGLDAPELASLLRAASARTAPDRWHTALQAGAYTYRLLEALDVRGAEREAQAAMAAAGAGAGLSASEQAALAAAVRQGFDRLRAAVRAYVDQVLAQHTLRDRHALAVRLLEHKPFNQLSEAEVASLRQEVARLARLLRARTALAPAAEWRGRLDLRRTMRRSLATGGLPFVLYRRVRRRRKPRLVVLCDVSDSVRNVSRFMLQLVYALQSRFDRVQSFAFVAELGELTALFRRCDIDRAMELVRAGAVVNVFANSNYGRMLEQFRERHLGAINGRTTVILIGDGRSNHHPPRADILAALRSRARRVLWLNPEPEALWSFGDSAMREYVPHCDHVLVTRDLDSLRAVIDELVS